MAAEPMEVELRAAFLHTFAQFVSYPADRFQESSSPFQLCMFEDGSVTEILERLTIGKRVGKYKILIKRLSQDDAVTSCHLLFVGRSAESRVAALLGEAEGAGGPSPSLTGSVSREGWSDSGFNKTRPPPSRSVFVLR